jgi:hypothetical protein
MPSVASRNLRLLVLVGYLLILKVFVWFAKRMLNLAVRFMQCMEYATLKSCSSG